MEVIRPRKDQSLPLGLEIQKNAITLCHQSGVLAVWREQMALTLDMRDRKLSFGKETSATLLPKMLSRPVSV